uniref:Uncharacterized protein n=1 Tax=Anguilla anguilla TaxID=7936 RepID=A0A0E9RVW6_ANGAN
MGGVQIFSHRNGQKVKGQVWDRLMKKSVLLVKKNWVLADNVMRDLKK